MTDPARHAVIAGAGCAGLTLAASLLRSAHDIRLSLIDPRSSWDRDRTWCFWRFGPSIADPFITHAWDRFRVRGGAYDTVTECADTPYCHVPSDAYCRGLVDELRASGRCEIRLNQEVVALREDSAGVRVETDSDTIEADHVFDARPLPPPAPGSAPPGTLLQRFEGIEARFDTDVFDPGLATVMDFATPSGAGVHFMYVLPFALDRALIESTHLVTTDAPEPDTRGCLDAYIRSSIGRAPVEIVRRETGCLPMCASMRTPRATDRVWPIGSRAGVARASTGYAFDAILRDSDRVARAFIRNRPRPGPPRARILDAMDRLVLTLLERRPSIAPAMFGRLFARTRSGSLLRFLCDRPGAADLLRVGMAMPMRPVLGHLIRRPWVVLR